MRKALAVAGTVLLVVGAGVAVTHKYNQYQTKERLASELRAQQEAEVNNKAEAAQKVLVSVNEALSVENETLQVECEKGKVAYEKLTPYVKTQTEEPLCD